MHSVVISDCDFGSGEVEQAELGSDFEVSFLGTREPDVLLESERIANADVLMVQWAQVDARLMDAAPNLKGIVRFGMGLDNVDLSAAADRGVTVHNVDDFCIDEVAEHAVAMIVSSSRNLWQLGPLVKNGQWGPDLVAAPKPPADAPVGIAGFGRIGRAVGDRVRALGYPVHYWDAFDVPDAPEWAIRVHSLAELAERSAFLTLHMPMGPETASLVDELVLRKLGPEGYLINVGRGGLVDEAVLLRGLNDGWLAGACLDVLAQEPPTTGISAEVSTHPKTLVTPHIAWLSTRALDTLRRHAADRVKRILA